MGRRRSRCRRRPPQILGFRPSPTADATELRVARRAAARALENFFSDLEGQPLAGLPAVLRRCFRFLRYLDAFDEGLEGRCRRRLRLLESLRAVLSRRPSPLLLPAIEVFLENLVSCGPLRSNFAREDRAAPEGSRVFTVAPSFRDEPHTILEVVCSHFISSFEEKGGFLAFLNALSWSGSESQGAPDICFRDIFTLINRTHLFSLPGVVQAHLLLLASRCVTGPDVRSHFPAFEHIIKRYVEYLPALGVFSRTDDVKTPLIFLARKRPFTCCIKEVTHQKLETQVNGLLSFCQAHFSDNLPISYSDIDHLIKENQHMLHEKFRQEASTAVRSVLLKVLHCAKKKEVHESDAEYTEEIICIAAILRLMGSLLLQILRHFRQMRTADDKKNANSIQCDTIRLLSHYEPNDHHRCDFIGTIGQPVDRERTSIQMLAHFASLSVFCVRRRLGFLFRVCIIMMMMAMNLVILEEESTDMFQLLIDASKESADITGTHNGDNTLALIPYTHVGNSQLQVSVKRSTKVIASRLEALRNRSIEKTDGRAFLQCHPEYQSSWNDLEDFFVCEQNKDYASYLNGRKMYKAFTAKKYLSMKKSTKGRDREDMLGLTSL